MPDPSSVIPPLSLPTSSPAWGAAFDAHYADLCEYVLRFVGSADATEDVVHDLFLHLWKSRGPADDVRLTRPYLFAAAKNRALKYLRHQRVADAWIERASRELAYATPTPEDVYRGRELSEAVSRALSELPPRCREIFVLRRRNLLSYEEIAARTGVSLGTVKSQMWRAAVQLKAKLAFILEAPSGVVSSGPQCSTDSTNPTSSASSGATARPTRPPGSKPGSPPTQGEPGS